MATNDTKLIRPIGDFRKLYCYQKAEAIYDITYFFVEHFLFRGDRTIDQMKQAARSVKQNISEGYSRLATSQESALKLIDVAKASSKELLDDYGDYLRTRNHRRWERGSVEWSKMQELGRCHNDSAFFMNIVQTRPPETIANMTMCLIEQNDYLIANLLDKISERFIKEGGFRERMTKMRLENKNKK